LAANLKPETQNFKFWSYDRHSIVAVTLRERTDRLHESCTKLIASTISNFGGATT
jgi:hypothetical protein